MQRFGVTESSDIVEMESSCSESEPDEDVEPPSLDSCVNSAPTSPKVTKTKIPSPLPDNHHPPPPEVGSIFSFYQKKYSSHFVVKFNCHLNIRIPFQKYDDIMDPSIDFVSYIHDENKIFT